MNEVLLQFETLAGLAGFSKLLGQRGYVMVVRELTLRCLLNDFELQAALPQYHARLLTANRAAA